MSSEEAGDVARPLGYGGVARQPSAVAERSSIH
jgi:hypothetical protein